MKAINSTRRTELARNLAPCTSLISRMVGLLGRKTLPHGEGVWIKPCRGVHTLGMPFPVDVVFLTRDHCVLAVKHRVSPNRFTPLYASAASAIELPAGTVEATTTQPGDRIIFI